MWVANLWNHARRAWIQKVRRGERTRKIVIRNLEKRKRVSTSFPPPPSISFPLKGVLLFLKKLIDFSSSNFSCDSAFLLYHCKVFASSLAGTCSEPPSSRTSSGKIFFRVVSGVFVCNCPKQLSKWLLERNHRFQDAPPQSFRVSKYYDLTSLLPLRWKYHLVQLIVQRWHLH